MKIKFVFFQVLLMLGIATLFAYAGKVVTVPAADGSKNVNELNGVGITVKTTGGDGNAFLTTTVQGDGTSYTGNPQPIASSDFPLDTTTDVSVTVLHIPCTPEKAVTFHVHSQVPTSLTFVNSVGVSNGTAYKFTLKDQNGTPIANAPNTIQLLETIPRVTTWFTDSSGNHLHGPFTIGPVTDVEATTTSNASGVMTDTPVGVGGLLVSAQSDGETEMYTETINTHDYTKIKDTKTGKTYVMGVHQNQTITQVATYDPSTDSTTISTTTHTP